MHAPPLKLRTSFFVNYRVHVLSIHPKAVLLGSPIGDIDSIDLAIQKKITSLQLMGERLCHFSRHDAILLLWESLYNNILL